MHKLRPGLRPGPHWGNSRRSSKPPSRLGEDTPSKSSPYQRKGRNPSIGFASECDLEYAENAFAAGTLPRTHWRSSQRSPRPLSRLGRGHPLGSAPVHIISGYVTETLMWTASECLLLIGWNKQRAGVPVSSRQTKCEWRTAMMDALRTSSASTRYTAGDFTALEMSGDTSTLTPAFLAV